MSFYPNGSLMGIWQVYPDDHLTGRYLLYNEAGVVKEEHWFKDTLLNGPVIKYHPNGIISDYMIYKDDSIVIGDAYTVDSAGVISQYYYYRNNKPAFMLDYVDKAVFSKFDSVFFQIEGSWTSNGDSGLYEANVFIMEPPTLDAQISYIEFAPDSSEVKRVKLPLQTGTYQYNKQFALEEGLSIALEYIAHDPNLGIQDTLIEHATFHSHENMDLPPAKN